MNKASRDMSQWSKLGKALLSLILVVGLCPTLAITTLDVTPAFAEDEANSAFVVDFETLSRTIGTANEVEDENVYFIVADEGTTSIQFANWNMGEDSMIAGIGSNYYVEDTDTIDVSDGYKVTSEILVENLGEDSVANADSITFEDCYGYWLMNSDYDTCYVVVQIPGGTAALDAPSYSAKVDGKELTLADYAPSAYAYYDYMAQQTSYYDVYTLRVPAGTTTVDLSFESPVLVYNYDFEGNYLAGWVDDYTEGTTSVSVELDANKDAKIDAIQVQNVYNEDYSGGELYYVLTFEEVATPNVDELTQNLVERFIEGGTDGTINGNTWAAAFALNSLGHSGLIDAGATIAMFESDMDLDDVSAGLLGKLICILSAAGVDCTAVAIGDTNVDLVALMESKIHATVEAGRSIDQWSAPCILPVYIYFGYEKGLIDSEYESILNTVIVQVKNCYFSWGSYDYMSTGQGILAIVPLADSNPAVEEALEAAWTQFKQGMSEDGSYPSWGNGVDDAALVVAASYAMGYTYLDLFNSDGGNPVDFILSKVNETNDGFAVEGIEKLSASSALLALAAMQCETGNPYDVVVPSTPIEQFVERLYENIFDRDADAAGKAAQIEGMQTMGSAQIVYNFFNSQEYKNKAESMSSEEQVELVYQTLLGREADEDGKALWTAYLDNGMSACALVAGFAESEEFGNLCADYGVEPGSADQLRTMLEARDRNPGITAFASRMYTKVLGRAPETDGLNAQCQGLIDGISCWSIAYNFFNSEEYQNKLAAFDEDAAIEKIVHDGYAALLGRDEAAIEEDVAGRIFWTQRYIANDLLTVVQGMCQSDEFEAICQSCGMTSGMR